MLLSPMDVHHLSPLPPCVNLLRTHHVFKDEGEVGGCVDDVVEGHYVGVLQTLQ